LRRLAAALLAGTLFACGGGDDDGESPDDDPVLRPGDVVTVFEACRDAFDAGHMREQSGTSTAAAREAGTRLDGQEARFVNGVCASAGDVAAQVSPICIEAKAYA
jgi:hypothetical protein